MLLNDPWSILPIACYSNSGWSYDCTNTWWTTFRWCFHLGVKWLYLFHIWLQTPHEEFTCSNEHLFLTHKKPEFTIRYLTVKMMTLTVKPEDWSGSLNLSQFWWCILVWNLRKGLYQSGGHSILQVSLDGLTPHACFSYKKCALCMAFIRWHSASEILTFVVLEMISCMPLIVAAGLYKYQSLLSKTLNPCRVIFIWEMVTCWA